MTILNLLIIYLACGSPFGVYQLTRDEGSKPTSEWGMAAAAFVLWPAFLIMYVAERFYRSTVSQKVQIEQIRADLEALAYTKGEAASLFEFRETFYRYTGLVHSASDDEAEQGQAGELITISGRKLDKVSSRCLSRRNREKVQFHLTLARSEFVDMIADRALNDRVSSEIITLSLELTRIIGDTPAADELRALQADIPASRYADKPLTEAVWKAQARSASNIS